MEFVTVMFPNNPTKYDYLLEAKGWVPHAPARLQQVYGCSGSRVLTKPVSVVGIWSSDHIPPHVRTVLTVDKTSTITTHAIAQSQRVQSIPVVQTVKAAPEYSPLLDTKQWYGMTQSARDDYLHNYFRRFRNEK